MSRRIFTPGTNPARCEAPASTIPNMWEVRLLIGQRFGAGLWHELFESGNGDKTGPLGAKRRHFTDPNLATSQVK